MVPLVYPLDSVRFVRTEQPPGGGTYKTWTEGGMPRYVPVRDGAMLDAFSFSTESFEKRGIRLELRMRVIDGAPQCLAVRLSSSYEDEPVTAAVFNKVDLEHWIGVASSRAIEDPADGWDTVETDPDGAVWRLPSPAMAEASDRARKAARQARRAEGGAYSTQFLRAVAEVYEANQDSFPTKAVRERFVVAQSTAQNYVKLARQRGFIMSPAPKGGRP